LEVIHAVFSQRDLRGGLFFDNLRSGYTRVVSGWKNSLLYRVANPPIMPLGSCYLKSCEIDLESTDNQLRLFPKDKYASCDEASASSHTSWLQPNCEILLKIQQANNEQSSKVKTFCETCESLSEKLGDYLIEPLSGGAPGGGGRASPSNSINFPFHKKLKTKTTDKETSARCRSDMIEVRSPSARCRSDMIEVQSPSA
jgi:hypothetical protein